MLVFLKPGELGSGGIVLDVSTEHVTAKALAAGSVPPPDSYDYSTLVETLDLLGQPTSIIRPEERISMSGLTGVDVPWANFLGRDRLRKRLIRFGSTAREAFEGHGAYITSRDKVVKYLRTQLREVGYDPAMLADCIEASRMTPELVAGTRLTPPDYSTVSTVTGRLVVKNGPSVLLWPKEFRRALRADPGYALVDIDYRSIEPQLAARLFGTVRSNDAYQEVVRLTDGALSREIAKRFTISLMYGAKESSLRKTLSLYGVEDPDGVISGVEEGFGTQAILETQQKLYDESGRFWSFLGRPIEARYNDANDFRKHAINYPLQSTAAEAAILGFATLPRYLPSVKPYCVVHDALVAQVSLSELPAALKLSSLPIDELGIELPVRCVRIEERK